MSAAAQPEMDSHGTGALAHVRGAPLTALPKDLYIPPDALEVFLESFAGPLDLLLYLIKRSEMDILDIPIAEVTRQYMAYVELMREVRLELAADYLVMAAYLAEIKSRMLLPRPAGSESEETEDPRAELVRRLQVYAQFQAAAERLGDLPQAGRDFWPALAERSEVQPLTRLPELALADLLVALQSLSRRAVLFTEHHVRQEGLSVRARMGEVLVWLGAPERAGRFWPFIELLRAPEGRAGLVVTLMAVLELSRAQDLRFRQDTPFGPIYVRAA
ncbi:MAG: segregation and condensation protein A [Pseudomonadota bacterium]